MKNRGLLILLLHFFSMAFAQNDKITVVKQNTIAIDCDDFLGYDTFGYYYFEKNNVLKKTKENENFEYKNVSLGKTTAIDILNPLKTVLFYENFNTAIVLDNQLNEIQKINFSENETPIVATAVGLASQNKLWVYNSLNQQIGLLDYLTNQYNTISTPMPDRLKRYQTNFNHFLWRDAKNNWFSCDLFGKISTLEQLFEYSNVQFINNKNLICQKENQLYYFSLLDNNFFLIDLELKTIKNFSYKDQILTIFTDKEIINYKIILP
jgi:hypothetical protein